uniref:Putative secreted protein n=1 Tax=Anopheles darlingi TaxID=43151 RepID=A0A2M4DHY6_ANODA
MTRSAHAVHPVSGVCVLLCAPAAVCRRLFTSLAHARGLHNLESVLPRRPRGSYLFFFFFFLSFVDSPTPPPPTRPLCPSLTGHNRRDRRNRDKFAKNAFRASGREEKKTTQRATTG